MAILTDVLEELEVKNKVIWFGNCMDAFDYLCSTSAPPFLIFCDVNLHGQTGIEFKKKLDGNPELRKKSIPFIFYSTSTNKATVTEAYTEMTIQGFFEKGSIYSEIKANIKTIIDYWKLCKHPNS